MSAIEGRLEAIENGLIVGWAYDPKNPLRRARLQIYLDDVLFVEIVADLYKGNLESFGDGRCAFSYTLPFPCFDGKEHTVRIKEKSTGAELKGSPWRKVLSPLQVLTLDKRELPYTVTRPSEKITFHKDRVSGDPAYMEQFLPEGEDKNVCETQEVRLYELQDCYVQFPDGIIFTSKKVLGKSLYLVNPHKYPAIRDWDEQQMEIVVDKDSITSFDQPAFLMSGGSQYNYYHWHVDILPRLQLLARIPEKTTLFFSMHLHPFQPAMLTHILPRYPHAGVQMVQGSKLYHFKKLYYTPGFSGQGGTPSPYVTEFYAPVRQEILRTKHAPQNPPRRVYVTRGSNPRRKLKNEASLMENLRKEGFVSINPGDRKYEEQVALFAQAEIIVAPHGAALTNLLYASENAKVLEIFPDKYINLGMQRLANLKGLHYAYILGKAEHKKDRLIHDLSFQVDIEKVMQQVTQWVKP